jgi:hypothetical protein
MCDSMKKKTETRKALLKAANFRNKLKRFARSLRNRQRKGFANLRIVGKPDAG